MKFSGLAILLLIGHLSIAQQTNERCRWIKAFNEPIEIDSLSIIPNSFHSEGAEISIQENISEGKVTFSTQQKLDSILICYKVFPIAFHQKIYHRNLSVYDSNAYFKDPINRTSFLKQEELFHTEDLYKSGSISRGISFGNNQDVFVNSALNLNLDGQLADNLFIRASITDQNVPYQPEGNTQQLQDFDNVFIELYNDRFSLTGGDVVFKNDHSHFLKYYKNVQGGLTNFNYNIGNSSAESSLGISVAKGRFASVQISPIEGLSGPYRIPGPNAERFILILANSERVFLDGNQLKRGFDNDYVIDYNSGELTFTSNILITQFSRIRVDYEFSDQNYSRAITTAKHNQKVGKLTIGVNAYSEQDNENRPLLYDLSNDDKLFLSTIGDQLQLARVETADTVEFSNEVILYRKVDVVDNQNNTISVFEYSNNPDSAIYQVSFSEVGFGNGDYNQANSTANGRVFEWAGVNQGLYSPTTILPTPNKRQMVTVAANYELNQYESVYTELAFSSRDENLYSDLDDGDNNGFALKSGIISKDRSIGFLNDYKFSGAFDFEIDDKNFNGIDRFRYIEYDRDWNFNSLTDQRNFEDRIMNASVGLEKDANNSLQYQVTNRERGEQVNGLQHRLNANYRLNKLQLRSEYYKMNNDQQEFNADWTRYMADISFINGLFIPGYSYNVDHNVVRSGNSDSVQFSSMYFNEHRAYIRNGDKSSVNFDLSHSYRVDQAPVEGEVSDFSSAHTTRLFIDKDFKNSTVTTVFNYRKIDYTLGNPTEETLSGRVDWLGNWLDNHIRSEITYSIANSQELKREFIFIKVPIGQGTHTWRDINEDGIQDLGEFFEAINPDERNYAKIFTPTNEFISAFQNLFVFRVNMEAPRSWREKGGVKKFISKFSNNASWSADTKITDDNLNSRLLAFVKDVDEEALLMERNSVRTTVFYNRTNAIYGLDFTYANNENKQLLTNGFESRNTEEFVTGARLNISKQYSLNLRTKRSNKKVNSDFLTDRNYFLNITKLNPQIAWQPNDRMRFSVQYSITEKQNVLTNESLEEATLNELMAELRLNKAVKSNMSASVRWIEIDFIGEESSPVGYDMLEALRPGQNITWSLNWQQKVTNGLQLNLSYNGRKSEDNTPVHIGRVQVSALF